MTAKFKTYAQASAYASPWSRRERVLTLFWGVVWTLFCEWTPKPFNAWRIFWLKKFGTVVYGKPFVHQRARINKPWNLILHDRACLGDRSNAYLLGKIEIQEDATVAQEAYLCTGTHQFDSPGRSLQTASIFIGRSAFVGARAFILPGVVIGDGAIVGACSVVTQDVLPFTRVAGNPAKAITSRTGRM